MKAEVCNFAEGVTTAWVFFMYFKLNKWYQIAKKRKASHVLHILADPI